MRGNYIDLISAYCDRRCERCAFTDRCSLRAVEIATEMCGGDIEAGTELAVGAPPPQDATEAARRQRFVDDIMEAQAAAETADFAEYEREENERKERIDDSSVTTGAMKLALLALTWFRDNKATCNAVADPRVKEAIEVARWDSTFIGAKLRRALRGRDEYLHDEDPYEDPVQNDWNGSAKVALICIKRSAGAWATIAQATGDSDATVIAEELRQLGAIVQREFPDARRFVRPGFDQ